METLIDDRRIQPFEARIPKPDPERILWFYLRNHHLMNMRFRRRARVGEFIAEFLCDEKKMVVELERGRSRSGRVRGRERGKESRMEGQGYKILRFWDNEVLENIEGVIYAILECGGEL